MKTWVIFILLLSCTYKVYSDYPSIDDTEFAEFEDFEADDVVLNEKPERAEIDDSVPTPQIKDDEKDFMETEEDDTVVEV